MSAVKSDDDDDDEFFVKRDTPATDTQDFQEFVNTAVEPEVKNRVQNYLNETPEDEKERFLHDYIVNMKWKEEDDDYIPQYNEIVGDVKDEEKEVDLDEDIKDIDQQDRYEYLYNTRFEQDNLVTYPRQIEGSMRRTKDKRKLEREAKRLQEDERKRREEELRRLRALKRQEIESKLHEIQNISGVKSDMMKEFDLDEDWDPDKYDAEMEKVFDQEYYDENEDDLKKPDLHLEEIFDEDEMPEELKEEMNEEEDDDDDDDEKEEKEEEIKDEELLKDEDEEKDDLNKEEQEKVNKETKKLMDELYALDYEDMIGDTPVRFHYTQVKPFAYGLTTEEIINASDKDLKQFVSMKKLAPYRDHEWRVSKASVGKFKAMLQKKLKKEEEEEQLSRKQEKKLRKKEKKERERYLKQLEEEKASRKKNRKRSKKSKSK